MADQAKRTPGPWGLEISSRHMEHIYDIVDAHGVPIGEAFGYREPDEVEANGRLMAAAPQLLEALRQVERWCADVVIQDGAWAHGGSRPLLTQEQCDRFAELQGVIATAIAAAKGEG